ncbi:LamG domain-containing protein [Candidatus Poribacteria bacterium]
MRHQLLVAFALVAFLVVLTTTTTADLMEGLVAFWPLDDGVGKVAKDATGNGHDGALEDGPTWADESKMGAGALAYDGVDDRIVVDSFDLADGSGITIAAWIKMNTIKGDARMVSKAEGGGTPEHYWAMVLSGDGDNLEFRLRTDVGAASRVTSPDGQNVETGIWTHIAVTWDANDPTMRLYMNGEEIHTAAKGGTVVGVGPDVKVGVGNQSVSAGADSMDRPFDGIIDDVAIWSRGLTPAEIVEMMTIGIPIAVEANRKLATAWGAVKLEL